MFVPSLNSLEIESRGESRCASPAINGRPWIAAALARFQSPVIQKARSGESAFI